MSGVEQTRVDPSVGGKADGDEDCGAQSREPGANRRAAPGRGTAIRSTRQGHAVSTALAAIDAFTSAQDLHAQLRQQGHSVGLTTVYRHLQVLAERGEVDVLRRDDGETVYRRCATDSHHHHLVCRRCGHTVEVEGPEIEAWTEQVAAASGFSDVAHTVEIHGLCSTCSSPSAAG